LLSLFKISLRDLNVILFLFIKSSNLKLLISGCAIFKIFVEDLEKQEIIYENISEIKILNKERGFDYVNLSNEVIASSFSTESVKEDAEIRAETSALFSVGNYWRGAFTMPCEGEISTMSNPKTLPFLVIPCINSLI